MIAERLSARQLILRRISEIVCMHVCMYPSRLGIQLFRALRANVVSRAPVQRLGMSLLRRPLQSTRSLEMKSSLYNYSAGRRDAVRTQRSGGQPEYEPTRATCNRLAQLSTCTYLLQRRCDSGARRVRSTWTFAARGTLLRMRISSYRHNYTLNVSSFAWFSLQLL